MLLVPSAYGFVGAGAVLPAPYFLNMTASPMTSNKGSFRITTPSGAQVGDCLLGIVWASIQQQGGAVTVTPPSGWTVLDAYQGFTLVCTFSWDGTAAPSFSFTTSPNPGMNAYVMAGLCAYRLASGVDHGSSTFTTGPTMAFTSQPSYGPSRLFVNMWLGMLAGSYNYAPDGFGGASFTFRGAYTQYDSYPTDYQYFATFGAADQSPCNGSTSNPIAYSGGQVSTGNYYSEYCFGASLMLVPAGSTASGYGYTHS